jgi:hypothetical protein
MHLQEALTYVPRDELHKSSNNFKIFKNQVGLQ